MSYYYSRNQSSMFLKAETDFGLTMLRQSSTSESLVVSPVSVILALATIQIGAKGVTKTQISKAISNGASDADIFKFYSSLCQEVTHSRYGAKMRIANGLFVDGKKFVVRKKYDSVIIKKFAARVRSLRFWKREETTQKIDAFVSQNTNGRIKHIQTSTSMKDSLSLIISAAYFTSKWEHSFAKASNSFGSFYCKKEVEKKVEYMNIFNEQLYYMENEEMQVLSLRYKDTSYALNIFLPKNRYGFDAFRSKLSGALIQQSFSQLKSTYLTISIPKMKFETDFKLKSSLRAMGINELFSNNCDLTGITKTSQLKVSTTAHKAALEVCEDGSGEGIGEGRYISTSSQKISYESTRFIADHPFIFVLTKNFNPLFIGQYV